MHDDLFVKPYILHIIIFKIFFIYYFYNLVRSIAQVNATIFVVIFQAGPPWHSTERSKSN